VDYWLTGGFVGWKSFAVGLLVAIVGGGGVYCSKNAVSLLYSIGGTYTRRY